MSEWKRLTIIKRIATFSERHDAFELIELEDGLHQASRLDYDIYNINKNGGWGAKEVEELELQVKDTVSVLDSKIERLNDILKQYEILRNSISRLQLNEKEDE